MDIKTEMMKLRIFIFLNIILFFCKVSFSQPVISGVSKPEYFVMLPNTDRDLPPDMYANVAFADENRNGILEAGENAEIIVSIYNCGEGRAQDVNIQLDFNSKDPEIVLEKKDHTIPAIFPSGTFQVIFPLKAGKGAKTMEHKMTIKILEKYGYDFENIKLTFNAFALSPARMEFGGLEIIDFGDQVTVVETDGRIQIGEKVKVRAYVQNSDKGIAKNVSYEVYSKNKNIQIINGKGTIGHVAYGENVDFLFFIKVPKNCPYIEGNLPLYLNINVENNNGSFTELQLPIQFDKPTPSINIKNLGKDLENYVAKFAQFDYSSNKISSKVGKYQAPTFTAYIKKATSKANGGGYILPSKEKVLERGVCWAITPNPTLENNRTIDGNGSGAFKSLISGLKPATTYYARAYASYMSGVVFGNQISFTSLELATLTSTKVTGITAVTAISGGNITSDGGAPIIDRGVCWSPNVNPTISNNKMSSGSGTGAFTTKITMLSANTTYYVRAYAINDAGAAYGEQFSFTTTSACNNVSNLTFDRQNYNTIEIGNQCWLKDNINTGIFILNQYTSEDHADSKNNNIIEKYCYDNKEENCVLFGGLYDWDEMMLYQKQEGGKGICPDGWHVPSLTEWNTLIAFFGGETVAGAPMKKAGSSGFEALAGGIRGANGNFNLMGSGAYFWTSTQIEENNAWGVSLLYRGTALSPMYRNKVMGLSVRCIKD